MERDTTVGHTIERSASHGSHVLDAAAGHRHATRAPLHLSGHFPQAATSPDHSVFSSASTRSHPAPPFHPPSNASSCSRPTARRGPPWRREVSASGPMGIPCPIALGPSPAGGVASALNSWQNTATAVSTRRISTRLREPWTMGDRGRSVRTAGDCRRLVVRLGRSVAPPRAAAATNGVAYAVATNAIPSCKL